MTLTHTERDFLGPKRVRTPIEIVWTLQTVSEVGAVPAPADLADVSQRKAPGVLQDCQDPRDLGVSRDIRGLKDC